jgi:hypothetical protein
MSAHTTKSPPRDSSTSKPDSKDDLKSLPMATVESQRQLTGRADHG